MLLLVTWSTAGTAPKQFVSSVDVCDVISKLRGTALCCADNTADISEF